MNISIASYSVHGLLAEGKIDAFGYLEACRFRYGLDAADFWNGLIGTTDVAYIRKVKHEADARELKVVNYHVDGVHLWEEDEAQRSHNSALAKEHLQLASLLGAQTVRFDTGGKIGEPTAQQFDYLVSQYTEYCKFAHDHGFKIGPENHWGLSLHAGTMERLAQAINHPAYSILLHLGHWEDCPAEEGDARLAPWTCHTHVDANVTRNNLQKRMQILLNAGYSGYWGIEHHSTKNEYAEIAYQIAEVRRVLSRTLWDLQTTESELLQAKAGNPLLTLDQERG